MQTSSTNHESSRTLLVGLLTFFIGGAIVWAVAVAYIFNYDSSDFLDFSLFAYIVFAPLILPLPTVFIARLVEIRKARSFALLVIVALLTPYGAAPLYYSLTDFLGIKLDAPPPPWISGELSSIEYSWQHHPETRPWLYIEGLPGELSRVTFDISYSTYVDYRNFRRGWLVSYSAEYNEPIRAYGTIKLFKPRRYAFWKPKLRINEESNALSPYPPASRWADRPFSQRWLTVESCEVNRKVSKIVLRVQEPFRTFYGNGRHLNIQGHVIAGTNSEERITLGRETLSLTVPTPVQSDAVSNVPDLTFRDRSGREVRVDLTVSLEPCLEKIRRSASGLY